MMPGYRRHTRIGWAFLFSIVLLGGLYAAALSKAPAPAVPSASAAGSLSPLPEHADAQQEVLQRLRREHFRTISCDDGLSSKLLDRYLEDLDPARSFLLQSDIDEFAPYRTSLDQALQAADLDPAFSIFNRFQQRRIERLEAVIRRLESGTGDMDFTRDEEIETERADAPWIQSPAELEQLWEKRLKLSMLNLLLAGTDPGAARTQLLKRFASQLRLVLQTNSEDVFQIYMNSLTRCYDPHTQYFSPRTSENFNISMKLSLEGIGAVLSAEDEYTKVVSLVPGGPADKSKLLAPADRIVGVGQGADTELQDVVGWRLDDVVDLIRGPKGTVVRLDVLPAGVEDIHKTRRIAIERSTVKLEDQAARKTVLPVERGGSTYRIGIIELPTFYLDFQALQAGDPGYKLRYGPVVQVRSGRGDIEVLRDSDHRSSYDGPLLVVVNRLSASASEIVAGALQDYGRAVIFGSQTFGKGTVQSLSPLAHGQLKATMAAFYRVSGDSTQYRGIIPDIAYPGLLDPSEIGESALPDALPWDTIDAVTFPRARDLTAALARLNSLHEKRMQHDPDYRYLVRLEQHLRALSARKSVSLSRSRREREQAEVEQARLDIENQLRAAKQLPPFENYAALEKQPVSDNETSAPDALVTEAAQVLIDSLDLPELGHTGRYGLTGGALLQGRLAEMMRAQAATP